MPWSSLCPASLKSLSFEPTRGTSLKYLRSEEANSFQECIPFAEQADGWVQILVNANSGECVRQAVLADGQPDVQSSNEVQVSPGTNRQMNSLYFFLSILIH